MLNIKKIFMIFVLIAFIGGIGVVLANVGNKTVEKSSQIQNKTADNKSNIDTSNMIEITDNFFIEQTNDVYLNINEYIGKTIKIEGLIYSYSDSNGDTCHAVVRNTPGCCGSDGLAGLDIRYNENYPENDTWVEVIGVVGTDTVYGKTIPAIQVNSIQIKEKGKTFVTN